MSLPIRYSPMASYFWLSIIFLTLQILQHAPCQHDLPWPLCDHHWLYPIPITPLAWYHIGDLPYDLWTTLLYFPFLVSFLLPNASCRGPTNHKSSHHVIRTLPYVSLHMNLVLVLLIICIQDFCICSKKKEVFPHNSDLSSFHLIISPCSISHLHPTWHLRHTSHYGTIPNLRLTLLDTTSGDHFTTLESHPLEPHRIHT